MSFPQDSLRRLEPKRICIIKPSSLGDVIHAFPVLAALKQHWPKAHVAWVINRGLRDLVERHPLIDQVIHFDRGRAKLSLTGLSMARSLARELRQGQFDLTIDLQGLLRSGLMTAATKAPFRLGLSNAREGSRWFYTHQVSVGDGVRHIVDRLLEVPKALGVESLGHPQFPLAIDQTDRAWAEQTLRSLPKPRVVLNVGARWITKRWPPAKFAEVARQLQTQFGGSIITVGAPEDQPLVQETLEQLNQNSGPTINLCGQTTLRQLAALSEQVDLYLSNDTGPLHLAAATGCPVLGVYTCTNPKLTGPYGSNASVVSTHIWCAASLLKTCNRMECMTELTVDRVQNVAVRLLDKQIHKRDRD